MIRRLPSLRTHSIRLLVVLSLFGLLLSSIPFAPAVQARDLHEVGPDRDGGVPGYNPDLGGDDDQPTVRPQPSRRMIMAVSDPFSGGSGGRHLEQDLSFFSLVKSFVRERAQAVKVWLDLVR